MELFDEEADDSCASAISMYNDWIFAGEFVYDHDGVVGNAQCKQYELTINADYPKNLESLRIMSRLVTNGSGGSLDHRNTSFQINVYDGSNLNKSIEVCEDCSQAAEIFITSTEVLKIEFPFKINRSWSLIFTAFHTGLCRSYEYTCANRRCIFHSLSCNGLDPCGDQSDCFITPAAYATIALGGFCAVGVLFLVIYVFIKSKKTSDWSSRGRQPRKFSPAKALQSVQAFTPATVNITPKRRWSYKY
ncbi:uncharacterized protein LOC123550477 [Mercenaria mercenaria]|uniref:uncharacterized protein LOC123550477 n=1 Tax=Mercenaria mercenaria TaxID=6596 RepID=UPI00234EEFA2|nr:uncharacterized protein LOC123550477 [Mercenaria mercenaria]